ncbi:DUF1934 family protein [Xylocopilactobacillus apis]|uniref:DUF1934 domain-containing protein n=1 Tax=Xylocopilactobacillus apis TaxID=2932183 RepID=A0AAU9CR91_9LACO|nr:DUF1934 family protein [Xylocopilactobacillus apis]BDR56437.1 hypothetical protein KIMC2_09990 [Xylocopilactobacillus apis]
MTKITYLAREIINNKVNNTVNFTTDATISREKQSFTIVYQEKLLEKATCRIFYNGTDFITINRITDDKISNYFKIQKGKLIDINYFTLYGESKLSIFGKEIIMNRLKDGSNVLKFTYDIYQGQQLLNTHKIYLQIKE